MNSIREQFPIFKHDPKLVYLDSAASAQKPWVVIDAMKEVMEAQYANVHRGLYPLSENLTQRYEEAREKVRQFIGARSTKEVIFTKNATEAINLVAYTWALDNIHKGDVIVVTEMEHHSNWLPWQMVTEKVGAEFVILPINRENHKSQITNYKETANHNHHETNRHSEPFDGSHTREESLTRFSGDSSLLSGTDAQVSPLRREAVQNDGASLQDVVEKYGERIKLVAVTQVSNVLGTINPIREIVRMVRGTGAKVLVDGCQAVAHLPVNVQDLDADFYVFSGHKLYGPTGIGVLYAKRDILEYMHPFLYGGEMVMQVAGSKYQGARERSIWKELPWKFEAGTPSIVEAVGLGVAIDFVRTIGFEKIRNHEVELMREMLTELEKVDGLRLFGSRDVSERVGVFSFTLDGVHAHDVAQVLGEKGICVRAGHHCAQPLHRALGIPAMVRASVGLYSTNQDIHSLIHSLNMVKNKFQ